MGKFPQSHHTILFSVAEQNVKTGWDVKSNNNVTQESSIGVAKKTNAAAYWDNKTTELEIPDMDAGEIETGGVSYSAPPVVETKMVDLAELNKDFSYNVPSTTPDGIDISLLTC